MNRREFLALSATLAGTLAAKPFLPAYLGEIASPPAGLDLQRHRFGVNYTPSRNWWFCWNDWDPAPIQRDLDAIAALGADHLRILLIWPYFQPNPKWVSSLHLERLDQLLALMGERKLDGLVTVFTGQLSGWFFLPPFNQIGNSFYTDPSMWAAQELFVRQLTRIAKPHANLIGFDLGNELNTCWSARPSAGDAWMTKMFLLLRSLLPNHLHVNDVDEGPWFGHTTFSQEALVSRQAMPVMHCYPYWSGALKYGGAMDPPSVKLLSATAALIRSFAGTQRKPVWAGEFNTCIESLTEKEQAQWLERAVLGAIEEGVSWFTYWDSHDLDRKFAFPSLEYTLGLLANDGRVKQQGTVFQQLAQSYRGKQVVFPRRSLPPPPRYRTARTAWRWMLDWMGWRGKRVGP